MRQFRFGICIVAWALSHSVCFAAEPRPSLASFFPQSTIAYAECREPAAVVQTLNEWIQQSPLRDPIGFVHDHRDALRNYHRSLVQSCVIQLALFSTVESRAELARSGGVAFGLTGFTDSHGPEYCGVIDCGASPGLAYLATEFLLKADLRRVAKSGETLIFQHRPIVSLSYDNEGNPKPINQAPPTEGPHEWTYAFSQKFFFFGSSKSTVVERISRLQKPLPATLDAPDSPLVDARKTPDAVIGFVRVMELFNALERIHKKNKGELDSTAMSIFKLVAVPASTPLAVV